MPLDQRLIQAGDGFSLRLDPKGAGLGQFLDEEIIAFSHGPFRHKGMFVSDGTVIQQNPPHPMQTPIAGSDLDALFDRGLLCHTRIRGVSTEQMLKAIGWAECHTEKEEGYGYGSIAELTIEGMLQEIPGMREILALIPNPLDYEKHPVCSVFYWLAWRYALGYDYAAPYDIAPGFITPADDARMIKGKTLAIIQDKGTI